MTGVQTCALPIFLSEDSSDEEESSDQLPKDYQPATRIRPTKSPISVEGAGYDESVRDGKEKSTVFDSANKMIEKLTDGVLRKISLICERKAAFRPEPASANEKQERNGHWGVDG